MSQQAENALLGNNRTSRVSTSNENVSTKVRYSSSRSEIAFQVEESEEKKSSRFCSCCREINFAYFRTLDGILNIAVLIPAIPIIGFMAYFCRYVDETTNIFLGFKCQQSNFFYFTIVCVCFTLSTFQFICRLSSKEVSDLIEKSLYEGLHFVFCLALYFTAAVSLLADDLKEQKKEEWIKVSGTMIGFLNIFLYGLCTTRYLIRRSEQNDLEKQQKRGIEPRDGDEDEDEAEYLN